MLALSPLGGSLVILIAFCSTCIGKCGAGYDVSHRRKSGCTVSGVKLSQICTELNTLRTIKLGYNQLVSPRNFFKENNFTQKAITSKLIYIPEQFKVCNVQAYEVNVWQCLHLFISPVCLTTTKI